MSMHPWLQSALYYYNQKQYIEALRLLGALIAQREPSPLVFALAGVCSSAKGNMILANKLFLQALKQSKTARDRIFVLEQLCQVLLNSSQIPQAMFYAQQLKQLNPTSLIACVCEAEFRLQNFLVSQQLYDYIVQTNQRNSDSDAAIYLKLQRLRTANMLGKRAEALKTAQDLMHTPLEVYVADYCEDVQIADNRIQASRSAVKGTATAEQLKLIDEQDLVRLFYIFVECAPQFAPHQVRDLVQRLINRFSYLLGNDQSATNLAKICRSTKDYKLNQLADSLGAVFYNAAVAMHLDDKDYAVSLVEAALIAMGTELSKPKITVDNIQPLCLLAKLKGDKNLATNLYFTIQQLTLSVSMKDHFVIMLLQIIERDVAVLILRNKTMDDFLAKATPKQLYQLVLSTSDDFEAFERITRCLNNVSIADDQFSRTLLSYFQSKKAAYCAAKLFMFNCAQKARQAYPGAAKSARELEKQADAYGQLALKQIGSSLSYVDVSLLPALASCYVAALSALEHVEMDQWSFCKRLLMEVRDLEVLKRLNLQVATMAVKLRFWNEAEELLQGCEEDVVADVLKLGAATGGERVVQSEDNVQELVGRIAKYDAGCARTAVRSYHVLKKGGAQPVWDLKNHPELAFKEGRECAIGLVAELMENEYGP